MATVMQDVVFDVKIGSFELFCSALCVETTVWTNEGCKIFYYRRFTGRRTFQQSFLFVSEGFRLKDEVQKALTQTVEQTLMLTDSTFVLQWLRSIDKEPVFIITSGPDLEKMHFFEVLLKFFRRFL